MKPEIPKEVYSSPQHKTENKLIEVPEPPEVVEEEKTYLKKNKKQKIEQNREKYEVKEINET